MPTPPKNIVNLVENKRRVYLPPSYLYGDGQQNYYNSDNVTKQISELYDTNKVLLDLGIEPLKRVVQEMHRLGNDHTPATHDPNAAKNAGLLSYSAYLKGVDNSGELRLKREQELVKLRTEMIMKGTYHPKQKKEKKSSGNSRSHGGATLVVSPTTRGSKYSKSAVSSIHSKLTPSKLVI
jgi:hypothetical protein